MKNGVRKEFFLVLANRARLDILCCLIVRERNVTEIAKTTKLHQTVVSHCLRSLLRKRFVSCRTVNRFRFYALNFALVLPLLDIADAHEEAVRRMRR
jgi:DNA-binding transcriptional ArsR family regulator